MVSINSPETAAENFHKKAEAYLAEKKFEEAIASCELAIKIEENYFPPYKTLGNAWQIQGKLVEAENWYNKALEIKSDWPEVYANLGSLYAMQQKWQEAISYYQKAVNLKPDFAGAYRNMTKVWLNVGNQKLAAYCQYKALSIEPEKATFEELINLGKPLEQQDSLNEAIFCYRMAIKLNSNSSEVSTESKTLSIVKLYFSSVHMKLFFNPIISKIQIACYITVSLNMTSTSKTDDFPTPVIKTFLVCDRKCR